MRFKFLLPTLLIFIACTAFRNSSLETTSDYETLSKETRQGVLDLMEEYKVKGVGIGVIQNGALVKTDYFGKQSPDVDINKETMFNVASTTKAITAEVFLRLASEGEVNLNDPISDYYVYADLADDPRYKLLTPKMILTHKTGFRNWPWEYEDGKLAFDHDPGTTFGYSGIGFYILAKYLEEKLWLSFPHLVEDMIFKPLNMKNASIVQESWFEGQCPIPVDNDGNFMESYDQPNGYWNPADDLHVSVEAYAKFLISSMNNEGLSSEMKDAREFIFSELSDDKIWGIDRDNKKYTYPPMYGYGLGWFVTEYEDGNKNIQHGGNDQGEASMAYFHTKTKNGLIVFCNGGNGFLMLPDMVDLLDKEQAYTSIYKSLLEKFFGD